MKCLWESNLDLVEYFGLECRDATGNRLMPELVEVGSEPPEGSSATPVIELITWVDSFGCSSSWASLEPAVLPQLTCCSVGRVIRETEDYVVVVPHWTNPVGHGDVHFCGDMTIPRCSILGRVVVEKRDDAA